MLKLLLRRCGIKGTKPTVTSPAAAGEIAQGEIWLNNNHESPGLFARADNDTLIEFAPSPLFLQDGAGAKTRTVVNKLKDVVSVKDFGAIGDGVADDTVVIQAAVAAAKHVVFPQGSYKISAAINIANPDTTVEGLGLVTIEQTKYPEQVFLVGADGFSCKNLRMVSRQAKTSLPTTVTHRYYGDTESSRSSAVYLLAKNRLTVSGCRIEGFICGVTIQGGEEYVWRARDGHDSSRMTATTFKLNAAEQRPANYWVGSRIRLLTDHGSYGPALITAYDTATNTVTFAATTPITLTGTASWFYWICKGRSRDIVISDCTGTKVDFYLSGSSAENLEFRDVVIDEIEQTQTTNMRPHVIYLTGGDNANVTCSNVVVYDCNKGQAVKFVAVDGLNISDIKVYGSRGIGTVEACRAVNCSNLSGIDLGDSNDLQVSGLTITASQDVDVSGVAIRISSKYIRNAAADRPNCIEILGSDDLNRGDIGTMLGSAPLTCGDIVVRDLKVDANGYAGTVYGTYATGTPTRPISNVLLEGTAFVNGGTSTAVAAIRATNASRITCVNPRAIGTGYLNTYSQFDAGTNNCIVIRAAGDKAFSSFTNAGTNNRLVSTVDQESGTFTPVLVGALVAGTNTYAVQLGDYIRSGDMVTVRVRIALSALSSTGDITITGLPYPAAYIGTSTSSVTGAVPLSSYSACNFAGTPAAGIASNTSSVALVSLGTTGVTPIAHTQLTATSILMFQLTYRAVV